MVIDKKWSWADKSPQCRDSPRFTSNPRNMETSPCYFSNKRIFWSTEIDWSDKSILLMSISLLSLDGIPVNLTYILVASMNIVDHILISNLLFSTEASK